MEKVIIKDLELLEKARQDISNLEKRIQELEEVKELKRLKEATSLLWQKIDNYSTYNSKDISTILAKLMAHFEGMKYYWERDDFLTGNSIQIEPVMKSENILFSYPYYKIINIKRNHYTYQDEEEVMRCYLPPIGFRKESEAIMANKLSPDVNVPNYIQLFLDFLYNKRSINSLKDIDTNDLEEFLREFIESTKDLQEERKKDIAVSTQERIEYNKRKEFEKSCVIDRDLIFNTLLYIFNNYELDMTAAQHKTSKRYCGSQWDENIAYHKLTVKAGEMERCFSAVIDEDGCYPDETPNLDTYKKTNICFFDIKRELWPVIKHTEYAILFMNMLEDLYNKGVIITRDRVQELLIVLSNERKKKQKALCFA